MPTISWTTENTAWVDGNDVGEAVQSIYRNNGFKHNAETFIVGAIQVEVDKSQTPNDFEARTYMGPCECQHFGEHDTNPPCAKVRWDNAQ